MSKEIGIPEVVLLVRGLPQRKKFFENVRIDSSRWDHYVPREGDVVVATYAKNGTTWMEQIVLHLIHGGSTEVTIHEVGFWIDRKSRRDSKDRVDLTVEEMVAEMQQQTHRRQFKTHLPLDHLPFQKEARYIVVGRPNRDVWLSWHNHYRNWLQQDHLPEEPHAFWADWIEGRVAPHSDWGEKDGVHPHFDFYQQWWDYRHLDNVLLVHFDDLLTDLDGEVARIARYLSIDVSESEIGAIVKATSFDHMKANADQLLPGANRAGVFLNEGRNGRWRDVLTESDLELYRIARKRAMANSIDEACLEWLERVGT
ncbi:sulfotransferase domain-containing protein [bacterium]|nr:sulfotransferase domain-containing protein [bacterium]